MDFPFLFPFCLGFKKILLSHGCCVILAESRAFLCCVVCVLLGKPKARILVTSVTLFIAEVCYSVASNVYGVCPWIVIVAQLGRMVVAV